jgi:6-phosphogluconolactonase
MDQLHLTQDARHLANETAAFIRSRIGETLKTRPRFSLVLAGGNTPRLTYQSLASSGGRLDWSRVDVFWGDERCVPHDHPESNFRMAYEALLSRVPIPEQNIHPMACDPTPEGGARAYEDSLRNLFPDMDVPRFDLVLLGLGDDGHTASLFPGTRALDEEQRWVVANWVERLGAWRLTLTLPVINAAAAVAFIVQGAGKNSILQAVLAGPGGRFPAQRVDPAGGELHWFVDRASGGELRARGGFISD